MYFTHGGFNAWMELQGWSLWQDSRKFPTLSENEVRIPQSNLTELITGAGGTVCEKCEHHIYSAVFVNQKVKG